MKCATLKDTKACLRRKITAIYDANMAFHRGIEHAILISKDAIIDFELTRLTDNVNRLAAQRQFSAKKFFCDLVLQIAAGPVLGSVIGHLAVRPMNAIARMRSGIARVEKQVVRGAATPTRLTETKIDELGEAWLATVVAKQPAVPPAQLSDFTTGIVVDSFQKINESLLNLWAAPPDEVTPPAKHAPFDRMMTGQLPTNLQMISKNAENYIKYQSQANDEAKAILEWLLARAKNRESLAALQEFLDFISKEFEETAKESVTWAREIENLSIIIGVVLYWGDPRTWGQPTKTSRTVRQKTEMDVYTQYGFDPTWPPLLVNQVLTNILVPGTTEPFLDFYTRQKSQALKRSSGPGITSQARHSELEESFGRAPAPGGPPALEIASFSSEYFTAKQAAFWHFKYFAMKVYDELTSSRHDYAFQSLLQRQNLLPH